MKSRLQKIIAHAGIASRRKAEELILSGCVTVNGKTVTRLGTQADPQRDHIKVNGKLIRLQPFEYYAVHKPRNVLSSVSDPGRRPLVTELVPSRVRLYPAGRLDFQSEGLMILTNDGDLADLIMHSGAVEKVYQVKVRGVPSEKTLERLRKGIRLDGEKLGPCDIRPLKTGNNCWFEVILRQGKNRQIRRMFQAVGHPVMRLRRIAIGPVRLGSLSPGQYRKLTAEELALLRKLDPHTQRQR